MKQRDEVLKEVFQRVGNASKLAAILGISRSAISCWKRVPLRHMKAISKLTNIPCRKIRPDFYVEEEDF